MSEASLYHILYASAVPGKFSDKLRTASPAKRGIERPDVPARFDRTGGEFHSEKTPISHEREFGRFSVLTLGKIYPRIDAPKEAR